MLLENDDKRKDCCRQAENLTLPIRWGTTDTGVTYRQCRVCNCRHFVALADPGVFGITGAQVG